MLPQSETKQLLNYVASIKLELKIVQNLIEIQPVNNLNDQNF